MLLRIQNIDALDLFDAATKGNIDRVESLLASGVDPNARWDDLAFPLSAAADDDDWASREKSARPPIVFGDFTETPALGLVSQDVKRSYPDKQTTARIMTALLQHGADPYALYRQPIFTYRDVPLFPGETEDPQFDTEEVDLLALSNNRRTILDRELQLYHRQQRLAQGVPVHKADECITIEEIDYEHATKFESQLPPKYGVFSVLHSLLESGMCILPVLNLFGDRLDMERRDSQGRTLFLSACRSALGLDAAIDGTYKGLTLNYDTWPRFHENLYPQPNNPWRELERHGTTTVCSGPSLLEYFVSRGAKLLAVDNYGKNALHQLFECIDRVEQNIPGITDNAIACGGQAGFWSCLCLV